MEKGIDAGSGQQGCKGVTTSRSGDGGVMLGSVKRSASSAHFAFTVFIVSIYSLKSKRITIRGEPKFSNTEMKINPAI